MRVLNDFLLGILVYKMEPSLYTKTPFKLGDWPKYFIVSLLKSPTHGQPGADAAETSNYFSIKLVFFGIVITCYLNLPGYYDTCVNIQSALALSGLPFLVMYNELLPSTYKYC
jgi:hypothetical protein